VAEIFVPLSNSVAEKITEMIFLQKRFGPSSKIPNEMQLAEELNVSRTSIREAVKILIAKSAGLPLEKIQTLGNLQI
jgi:DNA-binding FadR family transcriptional regulator